MPQYFFSTLSTKASLMAREIKMFDKSASEEGRFVKTEDTYPIFAIYRTENGKFFPATEEVTQNATILKKNDAEVVADGEADFIGHVYAGDLDSYDFAGVTLPEAQEVVERYKKGELVLKSTEQNKYASGKQDFRLTL